MLSCAGPLVVTITVARRPALFLTTVTPLLDGTGKVAVPPKTTTTGAETFPNPSVDAGPPCKAVKLLPLVPGIYTADTGNWLVVKGVVEVGVVPKLMPRPLPPLHTVSQTRYKIQCYALPNITGYRFIRLEFAPFKGNIKCCGSGKGCCHQVDAESLSYTAKCRALRGTTSTKLLNIAIRGDI